MMHANIIETPEQRLVQSSDQLAQCVKKLNPVDREYFHRRAIEEDDAAVKASCDEARLAHQELAAAYRQLSRTDGECVDPHLASELVMFRFNPKPAD